MLTVFADVTLSLRLQIDTEGLTPIIDADVAVNHVTNTELLDEDPAQIGLVIETLFSLAFQALGSIDPMALPEVGGFHLSLVAMRGEIPGPDGCDWVVIYADLE